MNIPRNITEEFKRMSDVEPLTGPLLSKCSTSIMEITPTVDHKRAVWDEPDAVLESWLVTHDLIDTLDMLRFKRKHAGPAHESWSLKQWLYRTNTRVWNEFVHSRCHQFMYGV